MPSPMKSSPTKQRCGVAEVASARPEKIRDERDWQQKNKSRAGSQNLHRDLAIDGENGEAAPGCSPERGVLQTCEERVGMEEINGEEYGESDESCGGPDDEGGAASNGSEIEQESEGERYDDDHGELGADGDRERDSQEQDAAPVPENDFAWGVESVGDGDGSEDGTKGSPCGKDFRLGMPDGGGLENGRRETIESEGNESAGIAAEAAGNIPQRSAEENAEGKKRDVREPAPDGEDSDAARACGAASRGAAVTRERSGECSVSKPAASREISSGSDPGGSGKGAPAIHRREVGASRRRCELVRRRWRLRIPKREVRNGPARGLAPGRQEAGLRREIADGRSVGA